MTDLLDAVDELTKPVVIHLPQIADDGKWLRAHTTELPSLLNQLEQAIASSMSGRAGGGNPAARSVLNSDALYEFSRIRSTVGDWCRLEKVAPSRDVSRDLRAWYVARLARVADDGFYLVQLHKWAGTIRARLEPPTVIPLRPACVECGSSTWLNDDGEAMPFPVIVHYTAGEADILRNARATCRACSKVWSGAMELRQMRYEIDERETDGALRDSA